VWLFVWLAGSAAVGAQWLNYPTPGIPRLANGAPNLKAPAPRTADGKPDFSGMWFANVPSRDFCREKDCIQEERMAREQINLGIKLKDGLPYTEWSKEQMKIRRANGWTRDSLKAGDRVSVSGAPARNFPTIANSIRDSSGKPMFTGSTQVYEP
jgi:hypothetical protein